MTTTEEVAAWLADEHGLAARPYFTFEQGCQRDDAGISALMPEHRARSILLNLRPRLAPGIFVFIGNSRWYGEEKHEDVVELVAFEGKSQFDILRTARTSAVNHEMDTEDLINELKAYDDWIGIDIFGAESDTVQLWFKTLPPKIKAFAKALYEFCPDIVDQGCGSVEALAEGIRESKEVFLWWD